MTRTVPCTLHTWGGIRAGNNSFSCVTRTVPRTLHTLHSTQPMISLRWRVRRRSFQTAKSGEEACARKLAAALWTYEC